MAKPRVTAADRLSNVIEVVELGRRSGLLSVERDAGTILEEGVVYFISGRPVFAALGSLRGRDALRALSRWAECRFAFDPDAPPPAPNVSAPVPSVETPSRPQRAAPRQGAYSGTSGPGVSGYANSNGNGWMHGTGAGAGAGAGTGTGAAGSGANSWMNDSGASSGIWNVDNLPPQEYRQPPSYTGYGQSSVEAFSHAAQQHELMRRPRRAPDVRDLMQVVTAYNLSRGHRTLLLLADGEHTIMDLVRLSSKPVEEVVQWLAELERYGLIYYYS